MVANQRGLDQYQHASTWIWRSAVTTLALLPTNIRAIIMGIAATDCLQIVLQQNAIIC